MDKFEILYYKNKMSLIISKLKNNDGTFNIKGKSILGIIGTLGLLFFYMLGYSFLYGFYFGNNYANSILEIGLDIVPINVKFVSIIGIVVLFVNCILILPIKEIYYNKKLKNKGLSLIIILFFSFIVINIIKLLMTGNLNLVLSDFYLLFVPMYCPLFFIAIIYIIQYMNKKKLNIIKIVTIGVIIFLLEISLLILIKKVLRNNELFTIAITSFFLLNVPLVAIAISFIESIFDDKHREDIIINERKEYNKLELSFCLIILIGIIGAAGVIMVSIPNYFVGIGNFYGGCCNTLPKEKIIYVQNNNEITFDGKLVGYKDGNYYFSKYPERTLKIVKSTQVTVTAYENNDNNDR
ncbi:hypothetical protein [Clostridium taeniosporum]|uniref:Uncharacterized protein n=1 Tax=Clostridium taeniosporum TaxID=394958 RepID=A0A1D7XLS1_9CLOT|nr:hypothetical protein [Clostridium taeniosporum]AOR24130.1 hypothetical protein BGI42_10485 [Clostridium taeniosporum]